MKPLEDDGGERRRPEPHAPRRLSVPSPKGGTVVQLSGAVVLVTGAGGGIGGATARLAARRGARVVCAGRDAAGLQETTALCDGATLIADLRREEAPAALVEEVLGSAHVRPLLGRTSRGADLRPGSVALQPSPGSPPRRPGQWPSGIPASPRRGGTGGRDDTAAACRPAGLER
jgi:threonine dehydrogenase-like Zn-dependent dehydrogenase